MLNQGSISAVRQHFEESISGEYNSSSRIIMSLLTNHALRHYYYPNYYKYGIYTMDWGNNSLT